MSQKHFDFKKQFKNSTKLTTWFITLSGIKLFREPWNKFMEHCINNQLFYYNFIIIHSVIFGEIYAVIDCIQTGKSFVELSFNLPCITISVLGTVKIIYLYMYKDIVVKLYYQLKEIHCEYDNNDMVESGELVYMTRDARKIAIVSVKTLDIVVLLLCLITTVVQVMFCLVPLFLMVYNYNETGEFVIMYPFKVKYPFFDVINDVNMWWLLIYFHQVLAIHSDEAVIDCETLYLLLAVARDFVNVDFGYNAVVTCMNTFACDTLFITLCSYIAVHFHLLGLKFENSVSKYKGEIKRKLAKAINLHQELIELVNQTEIIYSKPMLFNIVTASLLICLSAFIITITDEINVKFAYFTFLTMALSQISMVCYFADMLMRSSTQVSESVYKSSWYAADRDAKKTMLLVMIRSQKACKLTAWKFVDLNLVVFTKILSTSWSYFAVLRTMYK